LLTKEEEVAVFANAFAASLISSSEVDFETGRRETESGKLYIAEVSWSARTAATQGEFDGEFRLLLDGEDK